MTRSDRVDSAHGGAVITPAQFEDDERRGTVRCEDNTLPERTVGDVFEDLLGITLRNPLRPFRAVRERASCGDAFDLLQVLGQRAQVKQVRLADELRRFRRDNDLLGVAELTL